MSLNNFDWLERVRILESENQRLMACQEETLKDTNRKLLLYMAEIQQLRCDTRRMSTENQELRRLCCSLDDDREEMKEQLNEWKCFAYQAAGFIDHEVVSNKEKLQLLETRQNELLAENHFLQHLLSRGSNLQLDINAKEKETDQGPSTESRRNSGDGSSEPESCALPREYMDACSQDITSEWEQHRPLQKSGSILGDLWPSDGLSTETTSCILNCIQSFECRLRKLEQIKASHLAQSSNMQTSMSAPELEAACLNDNHVMQVCSGSCAQLANGSASPRGK